MKQFIAYRIRLSGNYVTGVLFLVIKAKLKIIPGYLLPVLAGSQLPVRSGNLTLIYG